MKKILIKDLPAHSKELKGKLINVIRQGGKYHYDYQDIPKMRKFIRAEFKTEKGKPWVYWYWESENKKGEYDCGFSGVRLYKNHDGGNLFETSYLEY